MRHDLYRKFALAGAMVLALGVHSASAKDDCTYKGTTYSEGSASCQAGAKFRCDDGEWESVGVACDQPGAPGTPAANCLFAGVSYAPGSASCQNGGQFTCENGRWTSLGVLCARDDVQKH